MNTSQIQPMLPLWPPVALIVALGCQSPNRSSAPPPPSPGRSAAVGPGSSFGSLGLGGVSTPPPPLVEFNTEEYGVIQEVGFASVSNAPLSTFSIDIDAASYANVRRFLREGTLPPPDAVRIEELVNYFAYDYPDPVDDAPFRGKSDGSYGARWRLRPGTTGR